MLDPYKTIGCFTSGPLAVSSTSPFAFAAVANNSFKIYSPELAIKMVSPTFALPISAISTANEFTFVLVGSQIFKLRYHHIVASWTLPLKKS